MRVVVLHNAVPADAPAEDLDTLVQVEAVVESLRRLGHRPTRLSCTLDLATMRNELAQAKPDVVFNLVESMDGFDSLAFLAPAVLDAMLIPYTGSRTEALVVSAQKLLAKRQLRLAGLPTPDWIECDGPVHEDRGACGQLGDRPCAGGSESSSLPRSSWIVKGVWDQGSRDMEDDAVLQDAELAEVRKRLRHRTETTGRPCFAERFIDGRELVVTMLAGHDGPEVHPPAEIEFVDYPPGKPRIVGYCAKWREDCSEYHQTPRRFEFDPSDRPMLKRLKSLAASCWELFTVRGWARVDFRVDAAGRPWILEVNTNPCLSPDAGFFAALEQTGVSFDEAIARILDDCR